MILVTKEILSISNPSYFNIPDTTIEDTARRRAPARPPPRRVVGFTKVRRGGRIVRVPRFESRRERELRQSRERVRRQREQRAAREKARKEAEAKRKAKITEVELEKAREETVFIPTVTTRIGARKAAIAAARRRGGRRGARLVKVLGRTAARRGRKVKETRLKKTIKKIKGKTCKARFAQDVGALTTSEARCELASKKIGRRKPKRVGGRRIPVRQTSIRPIANEREARLIVRLASRTVSRPSRSRAKRGRRGGPTRRTVAVDLSDLGISPRLVQQARAGLAPLDALEASKETITRRVGSKRFPIISVTRRSRLRGTQQNLLRGRANFLFAGGTHSEFDAIVAGDIRNRQSGRSRVAAISRGAVRLNRPVSDPFRGGRRRF